MYSPRKLAADLFDIVISFPVFAGISIVGLHILPHVYSEAKKVKDGSLFPSREEWVSTDMKDKLQTGAIYAGAVTGVVGTIINYYYASRLHPAVLSIPIATNVVSGVYEIVRHRRTQRT